MFRTLEFPDSWCHQSPASASRGIVTTPRPEPGPGAHWSPPSGPWTRPCAPSSPPSARTPSWTWRSGPGVITRISHWLLRMSVEVLWLMLPAACQRTPCWTWWCCLLLLFLKWFNVFYLLWGEACAVPLAVSAAWLTQSHPRLQLASHQHTD